MGPQQKFKDQCGWVSLANFGPPTPPLSGSHRADWVIIGGGFTGLAAARQIAHLDPQASILLIDGKRVGQGASGRNSGYLVANESIYTTGRLSAPQKIEYLNQNAIDRAGVAELKELVARHTIDCDWHDTGSIHAAADPGNFKRLHRMVEAYSRLGLAPQLFERDALHERLGTSYYKLGVLNSGGALVQPAKLAKGLLESLPSPIQVHENTVVTGIDAELGKVKISLAEGEVLADRVIVAVNAFMPRLGIKKSQVFPMALTASLTRPLSDQEFASLGNPQPWGVLAPRSCGATVRLTPDRRILMRNTAEYRPGGIDDTMLIPRQAIHAEGIAKRFSEINGDAIDFTWSGNICVSYDGKHVFEKHSDNIFAVGCYNASGVSRGSILGKLIVDYAYGNSSKLLTTALGITTTKRLPPRPFFDIGMSLRMKLEKFHARKES